MTGFFPHPPLPLVTVITCVREGPTPPSQTLSCGSKFLVASPSSLPFCSTTDYRAYDRFPGTTEMFPHPMVLVATAWCAYPAQERSPRAIDMSLNQVVGNPLPGPQ